jgi:phosphoglycolate phosphatase
MSISGNTLYKSIIFDLDGTLMNTKSGIINCLACILEKNGLPPIEKAREMNFIGPPMRQALKAEYGLSDDDAFSAAQEFRALYADSYAMMARTYPAMRLLLAALKEQGCKLSVATYKREDVAVKLLKHHKLDGFLTLSKALILKESLRKEIS